MPEDIQILLDQMTHHETMMEHHRSQLSILQNQYRARTWGDEIDWGNGLLKKRPSKSHGRWVAWLEANGPASRGVVAAACGNLIGEVPPYFEKMGLTQSDVLDGKFPDGYLMRIQIENPRGAGRPVDIYFVWSQRFDLFPKYGVGPVRPDDGDALLGVIQPEPADDEWEEWDGTFDPPEELEVESVPVPWEEQHALVLSLVGKGIKPTAEQFALLRSTHPDGPDAANVAVALASRGTRPEMD